MITLSIFQTVEFYVITCVVAAAVVALSAMPRRTREARNFSYEGDLMPGDGEAEPKLVFRVMRDGRVELRADPVTQASRASQSVPSSSISTDTLSNKHTSKQEAVSWFSAQHIFFFKWYHCYRKDKMCVYLW